RIVREMKEPFGQLGYVLLHGLTGFHVDASETVTGTNLVVRHQTDKQPLVFQGGQELAVFLADGPVDGVADEFTKGHAHVGPVDGPKIEHPTQVDGAGGRAAQLAENSLDCLASQTVVDLVVSGLEIQSGLSAVDEHFEAGAEKHIDGVLVARSKLSDCTVYSAIAGRADAQQSETFNGGDTGILNAEKHGNLVWWSN